MHGAASLSGLLCRIRGVISSSRNPGMASGFTKGFNQKGAVHRIVCHAETLTMRHRCKCVYGVVRPQLLIHR